LIWDSLDAAYYKFMLYLLETVKLNGNDMKKIRKNKEKIKEKEDRASNIVKHVNANAVKRKIHEILGDDKDVQPNKKRRLNHKNKEEMNEEDIDINVEEKGNDSFLGDQIHILTEEDEVSKFVSSLKTKFNKKLWKVDGAECKMMRDDILMVCYFWLTLTMKYRHTMSNKKEMFWS